MHTSLAAAPSANPKSLWPCWIISQQSLPHAIKDRAPSPYYGLFCQHLACDHGGDTNYLCHSFWGRRRCMKASSGPSIKTGGGWGPVTMTGNREEQGLSGP